MPRFRLNEPETPTPQEERVCDGHEKGNLRVKTKSAVQTRWLRVCRECWRGTILTRTKAPWEAPAHVSHLPEDTSRASPAGRTSLPGPPNLQLPFGGKLRDPLCSSTFPAGRPSVGFMSVATIQAEVLGLPAEERAKLIDVLWDSLSLPEVKSRELPGPRPSGESTPSRPASCPPKTPQVCSRSCARTCGSNVRFTSTAERELKEAVEFYEAAEHGLGAKFLDEVEAALARIVAHPLAWTPLSPRTRDAAGPIAFRTACSTRSERMRFSSSRSWIAAIPNGGRITCSAVSFGVSHQTPAIRRLYSASAASRRSLAVVSPGTLCEGWM